MRTILRPAAAPDLVRLMPLLDGEFVAGKNRTLSLARRFPSAFCADNAANIFLCEEGGRIASALAVRHFDWITDGQVLRGAMIGAVYADPERRREGLASRLLHWVGMQLKEQGADFGVLWTLQPGFYARLGWTAADCSLLGELNGVDCMPQAALAQVMSAADAAIALPIADADLPQLESMRARWLSSMCLRDAQAYRQLPFPAESIDLMLSDGGVAPSAYALVGVAGSLGIVYEMAGDPDAMAALFSRVRRRFRNILVNDRQGSPSYLALAQQPGLVWEEKTLAMWLPLSGAVSMTQMSRWHIPYFDRI